MLPQGILTSVGLALFLVSVELVMFNDLGLPKWHTTDCPHVATGFGGVTKLSPSKYPLPPSVVGQKPISCDLRQLHRTPRPSGASHLPPHVP